MKLFKIHFVVLIALGLISAWASESSVTTQFNEKLQLFKKLVNKDDSIPTSIELFQLARSIPDNSETEEWKSKTKIIKLKALIEALDAIQKNRIDGFDFTAMPMRNVAPPVGSGIDSGASPDEIKDPKLRQEYTKSLELNKIKIQMYQQQIDLTNASDSCLAYIKTYLDSYFPKNAFTIEEIIKQLEIGKKTKEILLRERGWISRR